MSLINKISNIDIKGQIRITAKLCQHGQGGAILNADINGEQKTTENFSGETVPKISTECLTNGIFKHRISNIPTAAFIKESKSEDEGKKKISKYSLEAMIELFETLKRNRVEYRGGAIMTDGTLNAEKSLRVDEAMPLDNNRDYFTVENRRLGVKGDSGENDYPRQQILYKNLKFFISAFLDLKTYNPKNNKIIVKFLTMVDTLGNSPEEKKFTMDVSEWLDKSYPLDVNGNLDIDKTVNSLVEEFLSYEHPVHRRFNSFLIMSDIHVEKINNREELEKSLNNTKKHHGI